MQSYKQLLQNNHIIIQSKDYVTGLLYDMKSKGYVYHNLAHTMEVVNRVGYLCNEEGVNQDLTELALIAAYFHDVGFARQYLDNEEIGANVALDFLREQNYPVDRADIVYQIILATKADVQPNSKLQEIIKDADIDNIGRDDFLSKSLDLRQEIKNIQNINIPEKEWLEITLDFVQSMKFYTNTQISQRQKNLEKNIKMLEQMIKQKV